MIKTDVAPWIANWIMMVSDGIRWYCRLLHGIHWYFTLINLKLPQFSSSYLDLFNLPKFPQDFP